MTRLRYDCTQNIIMENYFVDESFDRRCNLLLIQSIFYTNLLYIEIVVLCVRYVVASEILCGIFSRGVMFVGAASVDRVSQVAAYSTFSMLRLLWSKAQKGENA